MVRALILIDHGSRVASANQKLEELGRRLAARLQSASDTIVEIAHMELASPTVAEAITSAVSRGAHEIVVLPCMLSRGRHVTEDIPRLVEEAVGGREGLSVRIAPPLSELEGFVDVLLGEALR